MEAGSDLIRKDAWVAGRGVDLLRDLARDLVLTMTVGDGSGEDGRDDERTVEADGSDGVVEDAVMVPLRKRLLFGLREAEVDLGAPELVDAEVAVGGEKLLCADEAEGVAEVAGHDVLSAFAAGECKHRGVDAETARLVGEHPAVFVVGVSDDHHEAGASTKCGERLPECCRTLVRRDLADRGAGLDLVTCKIGWVAWYGLG